MTTRQPWQPESPLLLAVLIVAGAALLAVMVVVSGAFRDTGVEGMAPVGAVIVGAGILAALLLLAYSRRVARKNRPEWLSTQAWRSDIIAKQDQWLEKHPPGNTPASGTPPEREGGQ